MSTELVAIAESSDTKDIPISTINQSSTSTADEDKEGFVEKRRQPSFVVPVNIDEFSIVEKKQLVAQLYPPPITYNEVKQNTVDESKFIIKDIEEEDDDKDSDAQEDPDFVLILDSSDEDDQPSPFSFVKKTTIAK